MRILARPIYPMAPLHMEGPFAVTEDEVGPIFLGVVTSSPLSDGYNVMEIKEGGPYIHYTPANMKDFVQPNASMPDVPDGLEWLAPLLQESYTAYVLDEGGISGLCRAVRIIESFNTAAKRLGIDPFSVDGLAAYKEIEAARVNKPVPKEDPAAEFTTMELLNQSESGFKNDDGGEVIFYSEIEIKLAPSGKAKVEQVRSAIKKEEGEADVFATKASEAYPFREVDAAAREMMMGFKTHDLKEGDAVVVSGSPDPRSGAAFKKVS